MSDVLRARDFLLPNGERLCNATQADIEAARKVLWSDVVAACVPEKQVGPARAEAIRRYGEFHSALAMLRIWGDQYGVPGFEGCDG